LRENAFPEASEDFLRECLEDAARRQKPRTEMEWYEQGNDITGCDV
jgi:hypothetical protein